MRDKKNRGHHAEVLGAGTAPAHPKDPERVSERLEENAMREEIARRAHEIYLARGGGEGRDVEDWLRAEAEVLGSQKGSESREPHL